MTDRSTILREMGLTPIWGLRGAAVQGTDMRSEPLQAAAPAPAPVEQPDPNREAAIALMSWQALVASIATCTACKLAETRRQTVPGSGDRQPAWMVIGEAPDENDEKQGDPFLGKAGQLLDAMLAAVAKKRSHGVFLTHIVKCRPPEDRTPHIDEINACAPYLKRQITLASPKLLLTLGELSAQTILNRRESLDALRSAGGEFVGIPVVVTYHPSHLLRSPLDKSKAWDDLVAARTLTA